MSSGEDKRRAGPVSEGEEESRRILERVARDSETIGTSSMARVADRVATHFRGEENQQDDAIEIWGKRIGRLLALVVFVFLAYHIVTRYILP